MMIIARQNTDLTESLLLKSRIKSMETKSPEIK